MILLGGRYRTGCAELAYSCFHELGHVLFENELQSETAMS